MSDAYDLRSNMKDKPGSQGTLFQVKDKGLLNPDQRWPRGYTPERQRDVRIALSGARVEGPASDAHRMSWQTKNEPPHYPETRARFTDAIAQSTVPTHHIKRLQVLSTAMDHPLASGNEQAFYLTNMRELHVPVHDDPRDKTARNIVHEIGHHVHDALERGKETANIADQVAVHLYGDGLPERLKRPGSGVGQMYRPGVEEARADNYYAEHYKSPGRKGTVDPSRPGRYEDLHDTATLERHVPGYVSVRPPREPAPVPAQEHLHPTQFEGLFKVSGRGDPHRPRLKFTHGMDVIGLAPNPSYNPATKNPLWALTQVNR